MQPMGSIDHYSAYVAAANQHGLVIIDDQKEMDPSLQNAEMKPDQ